MRQRTPATGQQVQVEQEGPAKSCNMRRPPVLCDTSIGRLATPLPSISLSSMLLVNNSDVNATTKQDAARPRQEQRLCGLAFSTTAHRNGARKGLGALQTMLQPWRPSLKLLLGTTRSQHLWSQARTGAPLWTSELVRCCCHNRRDLARLVAVWITDSVMYWFVAASLAELASAMPSSGGGMLRPSRPESSTDKPVYHWATVTGGKHGRIAGWFAGWLNSLAWFVGSASLTSIFALQVISMYAEMHPHFEVHNWHVFLTYLISSWLLCLLILFGNKILPLIEQTGGFFTVLDYS
ncbi:hypothetical protein MRB53_037208 [Persea americana]|nr:hypothetical protein MRB53_037208 [Persea americana]